MGASGTSMTEAHTMTDFWLGRRVLLTGHTGFKGAWMTLWLESLGAEVTGYALPPAGEPNLWSIVAAPARSRGSGRPADRDSHGGPGAGPRILPRSARHLRHQCHGHCRAAAGLPSSAPSRVCGRR